MVDNGGGWGADSTMTGFEAMMWRAEAEPRLRSTGVVVDALDRAPEWDRLVAAHQWAVSLVPRLSQRVVEDPLHLSPPVWSAAQEIDLDYHLRRVRVPEPATFASVLTIAQSFVMTPLDPARPLWEALLVEGLADGSAAYLLKLHHCLTDGQATIQLFDLLHSDRAEPTTDKARPSSDEVARDGPGVNGRRRVTAPIAEGTSAIASAVSFAGRLVSRPAATVPASLRWAGSLIRLAGRPPAPPSPIMGHRGLSRRFGTLTFPLDDLRAAAKAAGGSLNDAYLAALVGGMRRYHEAHDVSLESLTVAFPVSLRDSSHPLGGNRFSGARIAGPVAVTDAAERVAIIRERVLGVREEPALDFMTAVAPALSRVPTSVLTRLMANVTRSIDLQASNIPGLARPAYIAGARITHMFPFGPAPGPGVMVTLISHDGACCIGVNTDAAAIPDTAAFLEAIRQGFNEVLALVAKPIPDDQVVTGSARLASVAAR